MRFRVPAKLKLQKLIDRYPPNDIEGFSKDKVYYVCHSIIGQMAKLDDACKHPRVRLPYYVPLSATILNDVLGNSYKRIVNWMERVGIINISSNYVIGQHAKLFKLSQQYNTGRFRWYNATSTVFRKKQYSKVMPVHKYVYEPRLIGVLNRQFNRLSINHVSANKSIDRIYEQEKAAIINGPKKLRESRLVKLRIKCHNYRTSVDRIQEYTQIRQDRSGHRLHTPLTCLKKDFRHLLRVEGQNLAEVDISNSQLFFLVPLMDWRNWGVTKGRAGKLSLNSTIWEGIEYISTNTNTIMFLKSLETLYGKGLQSMPFVHDACNGIVYERIVKLLETIGYFNATTTSAERRKHVKKLLLQQLFACPIQHRRLYASKPGEVWTAFNKLYPEVARLIQIIKVNDYKAISKLLQRIESFCMIRGACKSIVRNHPHIPIYTLHDCLVTTDENVVVVQQLLLKAIHNTTGYIPNITAKPWQQEHERKNKKRTIIEIVYRSLIRSLRKHTA